MDNSRVVLQKLLSIDSGQAITRRGFCEVGGPVIMAGDANVLCSPALLLGAYGFDADTDAPFVDVVRFEAPPCASLSVPADVEARPWPTYPSGFLRSVGGELTPVWELGWTRFSPGAEYWRVHADKPQELITVYQGAAWGWQGALEWRPASPLIGARANWQGVECAADVKGGQVELTVFSQPESNGWASQRPMTWSRTVPLAECDVFEKVVIASFSGVRIRVLEVRQGDARIQLMGSDPESAARIGATMIDQGVFENPRVAVGELSNMEVFVRQPV